GGRGDRAAVRREGGRGPALRARPGDRALPERRRAARAGVGPARGRRAARFARGGGAGPGVAGAHLGAPRGGAPQRDAPLSGAIESTTALVAWLRRGFTKCASSSPRLGVMVASRSSRVPRAREAVRRRRPRSRRRGSGSWAPG